MKAQKQHLNDAKALHKAGKWHQAEAIYLHLLDTNPGDVESLHLLGLLHAETDRVDTAVQLLRVAIGIEGPRPYLCRNLGIILERAGDGTAAAACYRQALEEAPEDHELWAGLARLLTVLNRHADAAAAWLCALQSAPSEAGCDVQYRLPLADALALAGERAAAVAHYDQVLLREPENVAATFHRAVAYMQENDGVTAVAGFRRTLALDPRHARAANNLGILLQLEKDYSGAIRCYRTAIREDGSFLLALYNLGLAWLEFARPLRAICTFRKLLKIEPENGAAWTNLGNAWLACNRTDTAIDCYRQTLKHSPGDAAAEWNLGIVSLLRGDFGPGWAGYERRFDVKDAKARRHQEIRQWRGEPLDGKTLLFHAEQGLGDTLQFIRYAPVFAARGARVVVECQPALLPLLEGFAGVDEWLASPVGAVPAADYQLPMMSAPHREETALATIPSVDGYLQAPAEAVARWARWLGARGAKRRVGVCWAGNPHHKNDRNRSVMPELLAELAGVEGVEWVSLQKGHPAPETLAMRNAARELRDFGDTAGLIANLDLVISVDTSVAHLAGALGKPVWVLLPFAPDWRWMLDREDSPWYRKARLFRQTKMGDWGTVLQRVAREVILEA